MPPHLHPRSRLTTSLFTTTLLASFLLVSLPHILPCPVNPHTDYAEGEMRGDGQHRRRRRSIPTSETTTISRITKGPETSGLEDRLVVDRARECPVPKPGGRVGKMLGFVETDGDQQARRGRIPVQTIERVSDVGARIEAAQIEHQSGTRNEEAEPGD
ncbi:MAG: hypothetical protein M1836_006391 [Candelina mexicana]|nr:MAG: hypothetical protein M1836_006391 [Candelina mexicana]